eukprot:scaffold1318_cov388-Prasinococcus_capsulatus_cf.AAC.30
MSGIARGVLGWVHLPAYPASLGRAHPKSPARRYPDPPRHCPQRPPMPPRRPPPPHPYDAAISCSSRPCASCRTYACVLGPLQAPRDHLHPPGPPRGGTRLRGRESPPSARPAGTVLVRAPLPWAPASRLSRFHAELAGGPLGARRPQ